MKAKTTKFLAVLAVLAVAFAGVTVLVQGQTSDAAAGEAVTSDTYADAIEAKVFTSIELENDPSEKSVVLYKYAEKNAEGVVTSEATELQAGYAYFFAENSDDKVVLPADLTVSGPLMFFVLDGVVVKLDSTGMGDGKVALIQLVAVSNYDAETGIITLADQKYKDEEATPQVDTLFNEDGYAYNADGLRITGDTTGLKYDAADRMFEIAASDKGLNILADVDAKKNFVFSDTEVANVFSDITLAGGIENVYVLNPSKTKKTTLTLENFTGTINYGFNLIKVASFTGVIQANPSLLTPLNNAGVQVLVVAESDAGSIKQTAGVIALADDIVLNFAEGAFVGGAFGYQDEYYDWHAFGGLEDTEPMIVGVGGLSIYAGDNMIGVNGTVELQSNMQLACEGNVTIAGMIYTVAVESTYTSFELTKLEGSEDKSDVKIDGLQIVGNGAVKLSTNALVMAEKSFYMKGSLEIASGAVLKVAEGAVVKAEGELTMGEAVPAEGQTPAKAAAAIWNAGQVIVPKYSVTAGDKTTYFDKQLIRVYMNSNEETGKFYAGSDEYDGTAATTSDVGAQTPLAVAYGAYLYITGVCDVNLTSNNITVENTLYMYWTLILATKNNTIPLTLDYPNQYPAEISFTGKDYTVPATIGPKSATFKNVVWESAENAKITIKAPEAYTVRLMDPAIPDPNADPEDDDPEPLKAAEPWTSEDFIVKDSTGKTVMISDADGKKGYVSLIFGEKYTITGVNDSSNYEFECAKLKDLKKESQTKGSFTMIRVSAYSGSKEPVDLNITEGEEATITVHLKDELSKIAVGEVILSYSVDKGKTTQDVVKPANGDAKFKIFNNQTAYIKFPAIEFCKFDAAASEDEGNVTVEDADAEKMPGWVKTLVMGYEVDDEDNSFVGYYTEGNIDVTVELDTVTQYFEIEAKDVGGTDTEGKVTITVTFSKYYDGRNKDTETIVLDNKAEKKTAELTTYVGEVYSMTWTDLKDTWEKVNYKTQTDWTTTEPAQPVWSQTTQKYTQGDSVTVNDMARSYLLSLDKIEYAAVQNMSTKDFIVTDGNFTNTVAKTKTVTKAVEVKDLSEDKTGAPIGAEVTLLITGQRVTNWTYTICAADGTPSTVATEVDVKVNGATAKISPLTAGQIIKITYVESIMENYYVFDNPDVHAAIGDYSQSGQYGYTMFVYYNAKDDMHSVKGVEVYYESKEVHQAPGEKYTDAVPKTSATGKQYWEYIMPDSNVVLKPIVESDYATIKFVNYDGTELQSEPVKKGEMPVYTGETPVKPATATETYRFAGWEPEVVIAEEDATYTATFETVGPSSEDVSVTIGQKGQAINVVLYAIDGKEIGAGTITIEVTFTYIDEDDEISTDSRTVTLNYNDEGKTAAIISDTSFIQQLGDYYSGAFAVTGIFTLGECQGEIIRTAYTPVEA